MTNARAAAVCALSDILGKKGRPKQSIEQLADLPDKRDRAFVMEIVYGVLRNLYPIDRIIGSFLTKTKPLEEQTMNNLRASVYQIFFMRVPEFALVHEAVELEKECGKPTLVNAVLRNILRQKSELDLHLHLDDPAKEISHNTSHPEWLVRRWIACFGIDRARDLAETNNSIAPLTIRVNTLRTTRDELLGKLNEINLDARPATYAPDGITLGQGLSFQDLSCFHGLFAVQDEASQLISHMLSPRPGERILDACAAPGGKATHIAQLMQDNGEVIAVDRDPLRLRMIEDNVHMLGLSSVQVIQADAGNLAGMGQFDRILLDAPCSSTGVIRKNPDVRYRHTAKDIRNFGIQQAGLLRAVAPVLRRDGILVYSVCSIEPEEGEQVISDFLKTSGEFRIIDAVPDFLSGFMKNGFFRTLPRKDGMDGFFGVILCRKK